MGEAKRKEQLKERAAAEIAQWGARPVLLQMNISELIVMTGALQLALRQPGFRALKSSHVIEELVTGMAARVPAEYPAIAEMIRLGFHPNV